MVTSSYKGSLCRRDLVKHLQSKGDPVVQPAAVQESSRGIWGGLVLGRGCCIPSQLPCHFSFPCSSTSAFQPRSSQPAGEQQMASAHPAQVGGARELCGGGRVFQQGGVGAAGACAASAVPGCDAGDVPGCGLAG
ncbi:hypothetical protein CIB84_017607 [Bambusicola thoracicus]|uniref:Uncharacterized protein n=1 Tax=Bambusicola thoracicus TaxID=9083 RepID=A0A2P4S3E6_BAMTH|nr:hypothetical protein CIB84_017607 [Bambusicola thoracicus]